MAFVENSNASWLGRLSLETGSPKFPGSTRGNFDTVMSDSWKALMGKYELKHFRVLKNKKKKKNSSKTFHEIPKTKLNISYSNFFFCS